MFPKELVCKELCENTEELYKFFKRTKLISVGQLQDDELALRLNVEKQVLCIVTTRKQAQAVFKLLNEDGSFHLSTFMYPLHRKEVLHQIRWRLDNGLPCRVVSTSLIEAGVDVDFPVVYRAQAGVDSEVQAAGRCNREGKRDICPVYIFEPALEYQNTLSSSFKRPVGITKSLSEQFEDLSSPEAIKAYFLQLYDITGEGIDFKKIVERLENGFEQNYSFPFASVAEEFKLIDNFTKSVIINTK